MLLALERANIPARNSGWPSSWKKAKRLSSLRIFGGGGVPRRFVGVVCSALSLGTLQRVPLEVEYLQIKSNSAVNPTSRNNIVLTHW